MNTNHAVQNEHRVSSETRLWQAVIVTTIQEWMSGPLGSSRRAEQYLFDDNKDFPLVCRSAGMDLNRLRAGLARLRHRSPRAENVPARA
jgi:hypothetical protein